MIAIAIYSADQTLRRRLAELPREHPAITLVGIADNPAALEALVERHHLDVVLSGEAPANGELADGQARYRRAAWVVFPEKADEQGALEALSAGASAVRASSESSCSEPSPVATGTPARLNGGCGVRLDGGCAIAVDPVC